MLFKLLLYTHIIAGSLGLLTGTLVMILKKGDANEVNFFAKNAFYWAKCIQILPL